MTLDELGMWHTLYDYEDSNKHIARMSYCASSWFYRTFPSIAGKRMSCEEAASIIDNERKRIRYLLDPEFRINFDRINELGDKNWKSVMANTNKAISLGYLSRIDYEASFNRLSIKTQERLLTYFSAVHESVSEIYWEKRLAAIWTEDPRWHNTPHIRMTIGARELSTKFNRILQELYRDLTKPNNVAWKQNYIDRIMSMTD